ncbi:daptide-type RiPP [Paenibacillus pini]|nr:daptide-type RiPP [Paenibacillus pini]
MMMEELERVEAPSDATFWEGAAIGTVAVVGIGLLFCS